MTSERDDRIGTEDLERGLRAGHARQFAIIALIAIAMLATFNAGGLARWTQALPSNAATLWLAEQAADWHALMRRLGPAALYDKARGKTE